MFPQAFRSTDLNVINREGAVSLLWKCGVLAVTAFPDDAK